MRRIVLLPVITVAAINGHGFGVGFFMPLVCDYRIMNSEKGACSHAVEAVATIH